MSVIQDIFGMPLFPHIYAIPMSILVGVFIGFFIRGKLEDKPTQKPKRPQV